MDVDYLESQKGTSYGATCVRPWKYLNSPEGDIDKVVKHFEDVPWDDTDARSDQEDTSPDSIFSTATFLIGETSSRWKGVMTEYISSMMVIPTWMQQQQISETENSNSSSSSSSNESNSNNSTDIDIHGDEMKVSSSRFTYLYQSLMVFGLIAVLSVGYAGQRMMSSNSSSSSSSEETTVHTGSTYSEIAAEYDDKVIISVSLEDIGELRPIHSLEDVQVSAAKVTELSATGIPITLIVAHNAPPLNDGLFAEVTNEYSGTGTKMFAYPFLKDAILMEPYRDSTVTMKGFTVGCNLEYILTGITNPSIILTQKIKESEDGIFQIHPTKTGQYLLHVEQSCDDDVEQQQKKQMTQTVWVKYVRRELTTLTDSDREEFLDAYRILWDVTTKDGIVKYGKLYKSVAYLSTVHNDAGANSICDEFHAGTGFLNNHVYLGMYLEQSLRLINPKLSMHYMDYSRYFDSKDFNQHQMNQMDGGNWTELMSDKYFGRNDPATGQIIDSRWAYTTVPYVTSDFLNQEMIQEKATFFPSEERAWLLKTGPHIISPYGLLRAPWNYNPSPFVTRYNNVNRLSPEGVPEKVLKPYMGSTCEDMKIFFAGYAVDQPMYVYLEGTEDNVHGYVHFTIGGTGGDRAAEIDQLLREKYQLSNTHLYYIAESSHKFSKSYLSGQTYNYENPIICTGDPWIGGELVTTASPGEEGGPKCKCNLYYMDTEEKLNTLIDLYFNHFMPEDDSILNLDFDSKKEIMELACQRMSYEGDLSGSGAAMDPIFWVVHGAVDRLFQRVSFSGVLSDKVYKTSKRSVGCSGHETTGTKRWLKGLFVEDSTIDLSMLTNQQLAEILDPTTDVFRELQNSVYADSLYPWCEGFDEWLVSTAVEEEEEVDVEEAVVSTKKGGVMMSAYDAVASMFKSSFFG